MWFFFWHNFKLVVYAHDHCRLLDDKYCWLSADTSRRKENAYPKGKFLHAPRIHARHAFIYALYARNCTFVADGFAQRPFSLITEYLFQ